MVNTRFFKSTGPYPLKRIASHAGAALLRTEESDLLIYDIAELGQARRGELSVFCDSRYGEVFATTNAGAVVTSKKLNKFSHNGCAILLSDNPRLAFARIGQLFHPPRPGKTGIHPGAHIATDVKLGDDVKVGAGAFIDSGAQLGARSSIGVNAVVAEGVTIGEDCTVGANTSISHATIGNRVKIASNVSIGGEGFGFVPAPNGLVKISQLGGVVIEDNVDIGNGVTIDRGCLNDTVIGEGSALDNLVHIAHSVKIGKFCIFAAQVGIAGSTIIADFVTVGGQAAINDHLTIGTRAKIAGKSGVMRDVAAGETVGGTPAQPHRQWHRQTLALARLAKRQKNQD